MTFQMNSPEGKAILAKARRGDFAHPGEEEAIQLVVSGVERLGIRRVLDVGCGRGGTAAWFHKNKWGRISGVDVDQVSINYARSTYPEIEFFVKDIGMLDKWRPEPFDFVYLFNSFYSFPDQRLALRTIRSVCRCGASFCLFDYGRCRNATLPAILGTDIGKPIVLDDLPDWLAAADWVMTGYEDCTDKYVVWYESLLIAFKRDQEWIDENFGKDWRLYVLNWYGALWEALSVGTLRGVIYRAAAA